MKKNPTKKQIMFLLLLIMITNNLFSQTNQGTDFWLTFGGNGGAASNNVDLQIRIATKNACRVKLAFTNPVSSSSDVIIDMPANSVKSYSLSQAQKDAAYFGVGSSPSYSGTSWNSLHITAEDTISVYALNQQNASADATNVLPVNNWGMDYYHISYTANINSAYRAYDGYMVIAKENGTIVKENGNYCATLSKGQIYYSYLKNADLTGRHITSNKPIAYFVTNTMASIPSGDITYSDCLFQQLPPIEQWGKRFVVPNTTQSKARIRVVAAFNGTVITKSSKAEIQSNPGTGSLNLNAGQFVELEIKNDEGCYISSNKPVGACFFMINGNYTGWVGGNGSNERGDPSEGWIAPIEQSMHNILFSTFIPNGQTQLLNHYVILVTQTSSKENTTFSIGGGPVTQIGNFTWTNVEGSNYSFIILKLSKNDTYFFDNPNELLIYGYGLGSLESYFYLAGSAAKNLSAYFTVNGENYADIDGRIYCQTNIFNIQAQFSNGTPGYIRWELNGQEIANSANKSAINNLQLQDGYYTLSMSIQSGDGIQTLTTHFFVGASPVIWTPNANNDKNNWNNAANWMPAVVPSSCNNVFIPGNSSHYPNLTSGAVCNNIYFMQGGELGRPDFLTYKRAYVQFNFDLKQSTQQKSEDKDLVLKSTNIWDRMLFSAEVSAAPIKRERWYMLSSPLKGVVTGDLGFGGFPLTFLKKFGPVKKENINYPVGEWTTSYTSMTEPVASDGTSGFAFYMYGYDLSGNAQSNLGCIESGSFDDLNDLTYLPNSRNGKDYGIKNTNGILELPFFADSTNLYAHRTQVYNQSLNKSTFYAIDGGTQDMANFNMLTGTSVTHLREANDGNYRFAPEISDAGNWKFQKIINYPINGLKNGDEFLAGNPYMSSIDVVEFCKDNILSIDPEFKIWNGTTFDSYSVDITTATVTSTISGNLRYIAPLQGFLLTYKNGNVRFDVTKISTVRPANSTSNLRNGREMEDKNILRIEAKNDFAASHALIGSDESKNNDFIRGEDVRKLFSPYDYVPEIYSLAGETPVDINFINNRGEISIPLGIKTNRTGEIQLTFTGMDSYLKTSKIEFIDALENFTTDLTGMPSYTYTFNHTKTGIQNGRFSLRFGNLLTALPNVVISDDLNIYGDSKGIFVVSSEAVQKLEIYDLSGKKVYENSSGAKYYPLQGRSNNSPLIVKVATNNRVKTVKIN